MRFDRFARLALLACTLSATGCALGTTPLKVTHTPFAQVPSASRGHIVVKRFVDVRDKDRQPFIGVKRNGYGMVLGHMSVQKGVELDALLTTYFAEALRQAGFEATVALDGSAVDAASADAVLEGEIQDFWLDLFMATWHKVRVAIRLRKPQADELLWERTVTTAETNVLWLGLSAEFEKVIRQALDKALATAIAEFQAAEFSASVAAAGAADPIADASTPAADAIVAAQEQPGN